jgi:acetoacetate decarboxylase
MLYRCEAFARVSANKTIWRSEMLKGFNYPLTAKGKSTLNPPPPWYYSSDFLNVEFWSEPSAVAALLPSGLDPDRSANGHANALFYDWQVQRERRRIS